MVDASEPLPMPIRVVVKGDSRCTFTSWMGGPRSDMTFPRVIDQALHRARYLATVHCTARAAERVTDGFKTWEEDIAQLSPDVVILNYTHMECVHRIIPRWLERHANSNRAYPGFPQTLYRERLLRPLYRSLIKLQTKLDSRKDDKRLVRRRERTMLRMEQLIKKIDTVQQPLMLVPEFLPIGGRWLPAFPGLQPRSDDHGAALEALIKKIDKPNVRFFPTLKVVAALDLEPGEEYTPDGGHYSPKVHRAVGEAYAAEILAWAADQPHLGPVP
jgi:hypothetical protein